MAVGGGPLVTGASGVLAETWTWNGSTWQQTMTRRGPSANVLLGLGWDPDTKMLLLFGQGASVTPLLRWEWTGNDWLQMPPVPSSSDRSGIADRFRYGTATPGRKFSRDTGIR